MCVSIFGGSRCVVEKIKFFLLLHSLVVYSLVHYNYTFHAALEFLVEFDIHLLGALPVAQLGDHTRLGGGNSVRFLLGAHKCLLLHTSSVHLNGVCMIAVWREREREKTIKIVVNT